MNNFDTSHLNKSNTKSKFEQTEEKSTLCYSVSISAIILSFLIILLYVLDKNYIKIVTVSNDFDIKKPLTDTNFYKIIKFDNKLEILLINDKDTSISSAAMGVYVGSFTDEKDAQGLAHLTEHLLFLGSKKYPNSGSLEDHLHKHSGNSNAFTDNENTAYYFEVNNSGFEKALDIFSEFFKSPLLEEKFMDKEINAVSSENDKNMNNDNWRQHQLLNSISNPNSKTNTFSTGNNESLRKLSTAKLNEKMKNYFNKYYISSNMRLILYSNHSIDYLENLASRYFSDLSKYNFNIGEIDYDYQAIKSQNFIDNMYLNLNAYRKEDLNKILWWKKLSSDQSIDILFYFNLNESEHYKSKPFSYFAYLINFSGEGSLFSILDDKKFCTKVDAGIVSTKKDYVFFGISLSLTKLGFQNSDEVLKIVNSYLSKIQSDEINETLYNEISIIEKSKFNFMDRMNDYGKSLALYSNKLKLYKNEIFYIDYDYNYFNKTLQNFVKKNLKFENSIIMIGSEDFPENLNFKSNFTEYWYKTEYSIRNIANLEFNTDVNYRFVTREKNLFITNEQSLTEYNPNCEKCENRNLSVESLKNSDINLNNRTKIYIKSDNYFRIPKVNTYIKIFYLVENAKEYSNIVLLNTYLNFYISNSLSQANESGNNISFETNEK